MEHLERNVMHAIKMNRVELLAIVRANSVTHVAQYLESVEDYKSLVLKTAYENLEYAKTGNVVEFKKIKAMPATPASYEDSYKRAIRMLELSIEDIIEIEEDVFNQLVLDEWSWKRSFTATTASYKVGSGF